MGTARARKVNPSELISAATHRLDALPARTAIDPLCSWRTDPYAATKWHTGC